jgi:hypothetical protein
MHGNRDGLLEGVEGTIYLAVEERVIMEGLGDVMGAVVATVAEEVNR